MPDVDGPVHRYIGASPGCWAAFGELSEKQLGDYRYGRSHQPAVDAYCVQHPGEPSPQAIRSVAVHLISLHVQLERGARPEELYALRQRVVDLAKRGSKRLFWLEPPTSTGKVTVLDVLGAQDPAGHEELVLRWAREAWEAWSPHHETIRRWAEGL